MNLALLAKQCRRLTAHQNSLFHQVFKGKYIKYGDILSAELGANPSWAWRSILEGRKVIKKGLKWRMGKGINIQVYEDPWITNSCPFSMPRSIQSNPNLTLVHQLMQQDGSQDTKLIRANFPQLIANQILAITPTGSDDSRIWNLNQGANYTVSSGYKLAFGFFQPLIEVFPAYMRNKEMCQSIWSFKVPHKVKIFIWKLIHQGVLVKVNLKKMLPWIADSCPRCNSHQESISHCLLKCHQSETAWRLLSWAPSIRNQEFKRFADWWDHYFQH